MYVTSKFKLGACVEDTVSGKTKLPKNGVCFPKPCGSTSPTSDYDVSLIGQESGLVVAEFNKRFEAPINDAPMDYKSLGKTASYFGKPSEQVFDTNIYAYSLEYAMPSLYDGLGTFYRNLMRKLDFYPQFQMLELVGAYMKV